MNLVGLGIGILFSAAISGSLIWIIGQLGLGLTVDGLVPAFLAGFAIAAVGGVLTWLLNRWDIKIANSLLRAGVNVLLGTVVLLLVDPFIVGLSVNGVSGALLASTVIGVVAWLVSLVFKHVNQAAARKPKAERLP